MSAEGLNDDLGGDYVNMGDLQSNSSPTQSPEVINSTTSVPNTPFDEGANDDYVYMARDVESNPSPTQSPEVIDSTTSVQNAPLEDDANDDYVDMMKDTESNPSPTQSPTGMSSTRTTSAPKTPQMATFPSISLGWSDLSKKLVYIEVASIILITAVGMMIADSRGNEELADFMSPTLQNYGLTVGVTALFVCLMTRVIEKAKPGSLATRICVLVPVLVTVIEKKFTVEMALAGVMTLWWLIGASVMTFKGPFVEPSNGYFAAWLGLIGSIMWFAPLMIKDADKMVTEMKAKTRCMAIVIISSIILIAVSVKLMPAMEGILGVSVSAYSILILLLLWVGYGKHPKIVDRVLAIVLGASWIAATILLTFQGGPFSLAGNGMFACWAGTFCSVLIFFIEFDSQGEM